MSTAVIANPTRIRYSASAASRLADPSGSADAGIAAHTAADPAIADAPTRSRRSKVIIGSLVSAVCLAFGVALWGGYTQGWEWTGVTDQDTLWHWMQLLMVPIAFATLPLVLKGHQKMHRERKLLLFAALVGFVAFVIVGYAVPLDWTGFTGNTLWDWMSLLLLPMTITSVRFLRAERKLGVFHYASFAVILTGFVILVVFGYMAPWDWTGFTGNTLLDWVQLLFLPIVFPTVVVPAVANWLTASKERTARHAAEAAADSSERTIAVRS